MDNGGNDADDTAGKFAVRRVLIGGPYVIAETQPPAGYIGDERDLRGHHRSQPGVPVPDHGPGRNLRQHPRLDPLAEGGHELEPPRRLDVHRHPEPVDRRGSPADRRGQRRQRRRPDCRRVPRQQRPDRHVFRPGDRGPDRLHPRLRARPTRRSPPTRTGSITPRSPSAPSSTTWARSAGSSTGRTGQTLLGGAVFSVSPDPDVGTGSLSVGDCVALPCNGPDKDETPGEFELQNVPVGSYTIVETHRARRLRPRRDRR